MSKQVSEVFICPICGGRFIQMDVKQHNATHENIFNTFFKSINQFKKNKPWEGRPDNEHFGVYMALEYRNPRFQGFEFSGITNEQAEQFKNGKGEKLIQYGGGTGHDRFGYWVIDGITFKYHANWNCGAIHFLRK